MTPQANSEPWNPSLRPQLSIVLLPGNRRGLRRLSGCCPSFAAPSRARECGRRRAQLGRAGSRADRRNRRVLAGSYPAGENRRKEKTSAGQGDPRAVPALAVVRGHAVAARLAMGLLEAGDVQARLRHGCRRTGHEPPPTPPQANEPKPWSPRNAPAGTEMPNSKADRAGRSSRKAVLWKSSCC